MAPLIQAEPLPPEDELRPLIAQSLAGVLGVSRVLVAELPLPGPSGVSPAMSHASVSNVSARMLAPMLALDAEGLPVVVSFDLGDGSAALIGGASAHAALTGRGAWLARLCPSIPTDTPLESMRVLVLAPHIGEGLPLLISGNENLALATMAALRVGGELSLMLTPWQSSLAHGFPQGIRDGHLSTHFRTGTITLSDAEEAFFRSL
ncbi:MAG: hypothetical protein OEW11_08415 [Nitrospirota bacterium]|nr:hypothetical protein [Nitrospirota bacterium]